MPLVREHLLHRAGGRGFKSHHPLKTLLATVGYTDMNTLELIANQFSGMMLDDLTTLERNILKYLVDIDYLKIVDSDNGKVIVWVVSNAA